MQKIKAIIFDMDDTLLQSRKIRYQAIKYTGKQFYNLEINDQKIEKHWGEPFEDFIHHVFDGVDEIKSINNHYYEVIKQFPNVAFEEAVDVIRVLSQKFVLGILSSASQELVHHDLDQAGFNVDWFSYIQTANDTKLHKPDPQVFQPLLHYFQLKTIQPIEIMYVGDSLTDFQAATEAGLHFVGIARNPRDQAGFENVDSPYITSLEQLESFIFRTPSNTST